MEIHKQQFTQFLDSENSVNCVLLSAEQIAEIFAIYSSPCPIISGRARQRYYRIRKKYIIKQTQSCKLLYSISLTHQLNYEYFPRRRCLMYFSKYIAKEVSIWGGIAS